MRGWVLAAALALTGCNFDANGVGSAGPNVGGGEDDDDDAATSTAATPTSDSTMGGDEPETGLDGTAAETGDDPTGDDPTTGATCMIECPVNWECVSGGCINPDEGEACGATCGRAAPFCGPDGLCYDGSPGDPCSLGQCAPPQVCGNGGTCQSTGNEGDPCGGAIDCAMTAPLCTGGACHDGSDGDPCAHNAECTGLLCGPSNTCQDGGEGDPCADDSDCGSGNYCPWDDTCHDGSTGDPCTNNTQCDGLTNNCIWVLGATICSF